MADIVVSGNSSGSVTLRAPDVSGTTILTLPTTTGTLVVTGGAQTVQFAAGTVSAPSITTTGDTNTGIFFPTADTIAFTEGGVESMRIDSAGNVGIGISSPSDKLDVSSTSRFRFRTTNAYTLQINSNAAGSAYADEYHDASQYIYQVSGTERMRIDSSGNVGIGTSSPFGTAANRVVLSVNGTTDSMMNLGVGGTRTANFYTSATQTIVGSHTSIPLVFETANTERMRIDSSGNLLVGTTSFAYSNTNNFMVEPSIGNFYVQHSTARASGSSYAEFTYNAGLIGKITQNGTTAVAYNTTSDYRLKENIAPMTGALDTVSALKPVTYNWKADGSSGQGFIAHELQAVVPDCVTGEKDAVDEDGKPVYQGIDTSFLVATLTAAIQELKAKVTALEAQLGAK